MKKKICIGGILVGIALLILWTFSYPPSELIRQYHYWTEKEQLKAYFEGLGRNAPFIFILFQILQVFFAPIPGEASGFLGGYLFGPLYGFFYSSVGLSLGSWISFFTGRILGEKWVRKLIPKNTLDLIDGKINREGMLIMFMLFVLPGFPKDFLCLFLGVTKAAAVPFLLASSIGRMPGTLMLSYQGAYFEKGRYLGFFILLIISVIIGALLYIKREAIYRWSSRYNKFNK